MVTTVDLTLIVIFDGGLVNWRQKRKSKSVHGSNIIHTDVDGYIHHVASNGGNGLLCEGSSRTLLYYWTTTQTNHHCPSEN